VNPFDVRVAHINPTTQPESGCGYHRRTADDKPKTTNFFGRLVSNKAALSACSVIVTDVRMVIRCTDKGVIKQRENWN